MNRRILKFSYDVFNHIPWRKLAILVIFLVFIPGTAEAGWWDSIKSAVKKVWAAAKAVVDFIANGGVLVINEGHNERCYHEVIAESYPPEACWSCSIVEDLNNIVSSAVVTSSSTMYDLSRTIVATGTAIWIAFYLLKALGSFSTQDSGKLLDGLLTFLFKATFVYLFLEAGQGEIDTWITYPLLNIGYDIGSAFAPNSGLVQSNDINTMINGLINNMTKQIHKSLTEMQVLADMIICHSLNGEGAALSFSAPVYGEFAKIYLVMPFLWLAGWILWLVGLIVIFAASFYMFDVAFNLAVCRILLPLGIALWVFPITKNKLSKVVSNIVYYIGVFMFLPLGVKVANNIILETIKYISGVGLDQLVADNNSDEINRTFSIIHLSFYKLLIAYMVAVKIIPLFANDFCHRFFGGALVGNPISDKLNDVAKKVTGRLKRSNAANILKHQTGHALEKTGKGISHIPGMGFIGDSIARAGKNYGTTRRPR